MERCCGAAGTPVLRIDDLHAIVSKWQRVGDLFAGKRFLAGAGKREARGRACHTHDRGLSISATDLAANFVTNTSSARSAAVHGGEYVASAILAIGRSPK
jgi:hypothetical protein